MIGVILWSSAEQQRAVVWCENNGGLAYMESSEDFLDDGWPDCGEIVRLEEERAAGFHYARRVRRYGTATEQRRPPARHGACRQSRDPGRRTVSAACS